MQAAVTGRRFSFFRRFDIIDESSGSLYLRRWYLISTPWCGIYLHHIVQADVDREEHDHPWNFVSLVLRGSYTEESADTRRTWRAGSVHAMRAEEFHRIDVVAPRTWTLLLVGRRRREWGFYTGHGWQHWRAFLDAKRGAAA